MAMRWTCHFSVMSLTPNDETIQVVFTERLYLMLHHLADATIQVANFVNYNCHPLDDGNDRIDFYQKKTLLNFSDQCVLCFAKFWLDPF